MLLAVKTVKSDWCVSIRLLLVKKSVGLLLVKCLLCVCQLINFICKLISIQRVTSKLSKYADVFSKLSRSLASYESRKII